MFQPAHDGFVPAHHLHAIDAEVVIVLARVTGPLCHHQRPGDQRCRLPRPTGLDRQFAKVDVVAAPDDFLTRGGPGCLRPHAHHGFRQRQQFHRFAKAAWRLRLAQGGEHFAHFAQCMRIAPFHPAHGRAHRHALHGTEQIGQHRHGRRCAVGPNRLLEQNRRTPFGDDSGLDLRHLQHGGNGFCHPHQFAFGFEPCDKVP